jgi:Flp pilus assembly protein CpaB
VRVLALDQNSSDQTTNVAKVAKVVTMEVDPKQAEVVTLALQLGTLSLSLRSIGEDENAKKLASPVGFETGRYTLDSDISHLIPTPKNQVDVSSEVVRVLRGKDKSNFERTVINSGGDMIDETKGNAGQ